jgi:predicted secreted acid phosphatase
VVAGAQRDEVHRILRQRKLILVLDLDHTVLNSSREAEARFALLSHASL